MSIYFLLGMNEPMHGSDLLVFLIIGLIGFAISYIHRYFIFAVMPLFLWLAYYILTEEFSHLTLTFRYVGALIDFAAIVIGSILSWKKYRNIKTNLS